MKLTKNKILSNRICEIHLIKSKVYEQPSPKILYNLNFNLSYIMLSFKKALSIIFKYLKNNKRIFFIGVPKPLEKKINMSTIHLATPKSLDIKGFNFNKAVLESLKLTKHLFKDDKIVLTKIRKKPELIVVFNYKRKDYIVKESFVSKIPVIEFNFYIHKKTWNYNYNVIGNIPFTNHIGDNVFFIILNSLLNKFTKPIK